jgi:membrane fusion protein (multidrug efflux system)
MAEKYKLKSGDKLAAVNADDAGSSSETSERLYRDYERLRAELVRLRNDVRRLSDDHAPADFADSEEPQGELTGRTAAASLAAHPVRFVLVLVLLAIAAAAGLRFWDYAKSFQSTDDAQLDTHIDPVSSRITGTIIRVYVDDNQEVKAGQPVADIDPRDYQIAVDKARADYAMAQAQVLSIEQDAIEAQAKLAAAQATADRTGKDVRRISELRKSNDASQHDYDQYLADSRVAEAGTTAAAAAWQSLVKELASRKAAVQGARAALDQALLNLDYTKIGAPVAGIVGKRSVEVGQRVDPGEELLAIVRNNQLWVTANFKETQLDRVVPGERATVHVDTFGHDYSGKVLSIAGASGARYSILPPENATGNYVKVVQRIPVRIALDPGQDQEGLLRAGMSVEATIWLK